MLHSPVSKSVLTEREYLFLRKRENTDLRKRNLKWLRPCVYILYAKADVCLYVGASTKGWTRLFSGTHEKRHMFCLMDRVEFIWCNKRNVFALEKSFIQTLKPLLNIQYND